LYCIVDKEIEELPINTPKYMFSTFTCNQLIWSSERLNININIAIHYKTNSSKLLNVSQMFVYLGEKTFPGVMKKLGLFFQL